MERKPTTRFNMDYYDRLFPEWKGSKKLYLVEKDGKWGYISAEGQIVIPLEHINQEDAYMELVKLGRPSSPENTSTSITIPTSLNSWTQGSQRRFK